MAKLLTIHDYSISNSYMWNILFYMVISYTVHFASKFFTKKVNMKLHEGVFLIALFMDGVFPQCIKNVDLEEIRHICDDYCRDVGFYQAKYYCTKVTLVSIVSELNQTETVRNSYERRYNKIFLYINSTNIDILDVNAYDGPSLYHLSLSNTNTKQLLPGFFNKLSKLTVLEIKDNQLDAIIEGSLSSLISLRTLNLSNNLITSIFAHSFTGLMELESLTISHNKIKYIPSNAFSPLLKLKHLDLSHNFFTTFGEGIDSISLVDLDLSHNQLEEFPSNKNNLKIPAYYQSLELLNLGHNIISNVSPEVLTNIPSLITLNLNNNNLTFLPRTLFLKSFNLRWLDISFNQIPSIDFGVFNFLQRLEYLDISNNNMSLNLNILSRLKELRVLKLSGNDVKNFDAKLLTGIMSHLEELSLNDNMFSCKELVSVLAELSTRDVRVLHGNTTESDNIMGISCSDSPSNHRELVSFHRESTPETNPINILETFLNVDFKNTAFYRFFSNFHAPSHQTLPIIRYLNNNFSDTNFYKFLESFRIDQEVSSNLRNLTKSLLDNLDRLNRENRNLSQADLDVISEGIKPLHLLLEDFKNNKNDIAELNQNLLKIVISQNSTVDYISRYFNKFGSNDIFLPSKYTDLINENLNYGLSIRKNLITVNVLLSFIFISVLVFVTFVLYRQKVTSTLPSRENIQLV